MSTLEQDSPCPGPQRQSPAHPTVGGTTAVVAGGRLPLPTLPPPGGGDITALEGGAAAPQHITSSASRADARTGGRTRGQAGRSAGGRPQSGAVLLLGAFPTHGEPGPARGRGTPGPGLQAHLLQVVQGPGWGTGTRTADAGGRMPAQNKGCCGDAQRGRGRASLDLRRERWGRRAQRSVPRQRGWDWVLPATLSRCQKGLPGGHSPPGSAGP